MKTAMTPFALIAALMMAGHSIPAQSFNDTGDNLARSAEIEDIEYEIMVQRATQAAIWGMPAAGMIDFLLGIRRDLGGDYNDVVDLNKPFDSKHGFLTANDVTAYAWASMTSEVPYDSLPYYNETYFQDLNDYIQNNPIRPQDKIMVNFLKDLGIEKGKPFDPTERQIEAMNEGLVLAYAAMQRYFVEPGLATVPLWVDEGGNLKNQWLVWDFAEGQHEAGFPYETDTEVLVDDRAGASYFWITYLPKLLGGGTFYLTDLRDSDGDMYDHNATYKLNVPADTPAKDFWSVIVYSMETKSFIRNVDRVGPSSRDAETMQVNDDGSYDIYFGPKAPEGLESNWIPTTESYFLLSRLYGPKEGWLDSGWLLGDLEKL